MPLYEFRNKETGEVVEKFMGIQARLDFLEANPNMEPLISGGSTFIDPVRLGVRKPDQGFKEVLQRIHEKTPGSQLDKSTNV